MANNKLIRIGPVALTATLTTNILNPPAAGTGTGYTGTAYYMILTHIRILNRTITTATFSLWVGATGGNANGTEFWGIGTAVAPNSGNDYYGQLRLDAADFLVGGSNTALSLTLFAEGEVGLV